MPDQTAHLLSPVQLDTRPSRSDITSPMADPIGRGSSPMVLSPRGDMMQTTRRVRHEVADAVRLALFSFGASAAATLALLGWSRLVGAA